MFSPSYSIEIDRDFDLNVLDLVEAMQPYWNLPEPYPGDPYDHNEFRKYFSDHHPIVFRVLTSLPDDDGVPTITVRSTPEPLPAPETLPLRR